MRKFFAAMTRRERQFAGGGIVVALLVCVPVMAVAEPGWVRGSGPGDPVDSGVEQPLDVSRGDSCRDMLAPDTPKYVACRWMNAPQDAADVAAWWLADDGANLQRAEPLPPEYVRCNQPTDLSKHTRCRGGETICKQRPDGWYQCKNYATGKTTYERTVNGKRQVRTKPPTSAPSATPTTRPTTPPGGKPTRRSATSSPAPTITIPPSAVADMPAVDADLGDGDQSAASPTPAVSATDEAGDDSKAPASGSQVTEAIAAARSATVRVWVESDLADDYKAGQAQFRAALQKLISAAKRPGVIGIKFADNLGYGSTFASEEEVKTFLQQASDTLRPALPGKRLAIGVVAPELGCGASRQCITAMRARAPLATKQLIGRYIAASRVEHVQVSTGLFSATYRQYQVKDPKTGKPTAITPVLATRAQWLSIRALGWDTMAQIGSREYGLAHRGETADWDEAQATAQINARIGTVIGLGAPTVTLWGHQAVDGDQTYRLLNPGLTDNEMWRQLKQQGLRERLSAVVDPTSTERGVREDIAALAKGVSELFILV